MRGVGGERGGQPGRRHIGQLRGRRVDDRQHVVLRVGIQQLVRTLHPRQFRREQQLHIGRDGEMLHRVDRAERRQDERERDRRPGVPRTQRDEADDRGPQHKPAPGRQHGPAARP